MSNLSQKKIFTCMILLLVVSLSIGLFMPFMLVDSNKKVAYGVSETISDANIFAEQRKLQLLNSFVSNMNVEYASNVVYNNQKNLHDFAGNNYTLTECSPIGYMITCDDSAELVEYSATSPSPYLNYNSNLYYGGPTKYFVLHGDNYIHTITNETTNATALNAALYPVSTSLHESLVQDVNTLALDYIQNAAQSPIQPYTYTSGNFTYVNNADYFKNLSSSESPYSAFGYKMGYTTYTLNGETYGLCGFIAANILLGYYDTFVDGSFITSNCMAGSGVNRYFSNISLTTELVQIGQALNVPITVGTTSTSIRRVLNQYFDNHNINAGSYDMVVPFFSGTTLKNKINDNIPVILFGSMYDPSSSIIASWVAHAVVVYGYCKNSSGINNWGFMAHYGWPNYTQVTVNVDVDSTFGSMYNIIW